MPESGDLIGPYRLVSQLGKGAMGEVWRARDERLDRYVALKVLPSDLAGDVERRARMLREARAAAAIRHRNVVTLFDIVSHQGQDILVMELVDGRTLSEELRKAGPPALETALRWIEGVADALVAAHDRGVLHRDIKAANIMVTPDGVKVLDFGLAKLRDGEPAVVTAPVAPERPSEKIALDETMPSKTGSHSGDEIDSYRTHAGQLLGTPLYMAPEQIDGAAPDERSEVFSVGVLAHEILSGKPPYTATSMAELFHQIKSAPAPELEKVPASVVAIVTRALAKAPDDRYPTMAALRDAVAAERARLFAPAARRWPLVVAAALLIVGAGAVVTWWRTHRAPAERPGDSYVQRALEEYDVFYNDKALSSLRAALEVAPDHPRANAYMILFGGAPQADRDAAIAGARRAQQFTDDRSKDRALVAAAITYTQQGAPAARAALTGAGAPSDRELSFWAAELSYRSGNYAAAGAEYKALLADPAPSLRGRIYDHYSSVLLYLDDPIEALRIGTLYRDAFRGEADAVGVYATTLAAAGKTKEAIAAAEEALRLAEGEDTLAGLAKVLVLARARGYHAPSRAPRCARAAPVDRWRRRGSEGDRGAVPDRRRRCADPRARRVPVRRGRARSRTRRGHRGPARRARRGRHPGQARVRRADLARAPRPRPREVLRRRLHATARPRGHAGSLARGRVRVAARFLRRVSPAAVRDLGAVRERGAAGGQGRSRRRGADARERRREGAEPDLAHRDGEALPLSAIP